VWLEGSNKQMISDCYDRSESRNAHAQPKDGEDEEGDGEQMPTAVKSAATPAAKLDSRRGGMWYMFANEIANDISGQLDRLIESMHSGPQLGDVEKSALVADVENFRKASQAYRYTKFYQPAKEMRSEYQCLTLVQSYQCQIAETDWGVEFHKSFILGRLNPALEKELKKRTSDVLAAKNKAIEVHTPTAKWWIAVVATSSAGSAPKHRTAVFRGKYDRGVSWVFCGESGAMGSQSSRGFGRARRRSPKAKPEGEARRRSPKAKPHQKADQFYYRH
jgi:hypothetical protein